MENKRGPFPADGQEGLRPQHFPEGVLLCSLLPVGLVLAGISCISDD
ncbi:MAG: hypothetical protein ABH879_01840 [archaeon]